MKIATFNVNSIRVRKPKVIEWLRAEQPDVVCLQETKVADKDFPTDELAAEGYQSAIFGQKAYNGVAILAKSDITDVVLGFDDGADDEQARAISATVADVRIVGLYVPNGQSVGSDKYDYKLAWFSRLARYLERTAKPTDDLIVCGDFNVAPDNRDVHAPASWAGEVMVSDGERAALRTITDFGLTDLFRQHHEEDGHYSWWDYRMSAFKQNRGLRIDLVLGTPSMAARCTGAHIARDTRAGKNTSDHAPVVVELK